MLERILFKKRHVDGVSKSDFENNFSKQHKNVVPSPLVSDNVKVRRSDFILTNLSISTVINFGFVLCIAHSE